MTTNGLNPGHAGGVEKASLPTPVRNNLIGYKGLPQWGRLSVIPEDINWTLFDARNPMGARRWNWQKNFLFKHFDFYGVQSKTFTFGCGIVRLGLINSVFAYIDSPATGLVQRQFNLPLDWGLKADYHPHGFTVWEHPLKKHHLIESTRTPELRRLSMNFGHDFRALVDIDCSDESTLALSTPVANTGFTYAQKTTGNRVHGEVFVNGKVLNIDPRVDGCYHDWTAGFLRRETFWNWCCVTGARAEGEDLLAINLARGVNETSAHENELWVNGERYELPLCHFDYQRDNVLEPWRVYSDCGRVDLAFSPVGQISDHRNLIILASRFNQCYGTFTGKVIHPDTGDTLVVNGLKGWCEDHYAKW
jgi:hypothetical protein